MKNNEDTIEPNSKGEIYMGSPMSIRQNSDSELSTSKLNTMNLKPETMGRLRKFLDKGYTIAFLYPLFPNFSKRRYETIQHWY